MVFSTTLFSCIERYWPDIENKYLELIVIDGMINNDPGPYTIKLSQSSSVNDPTYLPLTNYRVEIVDDQGNSETLFETEEGVYKTLENGIQGIVGRSYKLIINSPEGKTYESKFEKIRPPVIIDEIYASIESKQDTSLYYNLIGYQFYLNSLEFTQDTNYIVWKLIQTYEYRSNYALDFVYTDRRLKPVLHFDSLRRCWKETTLSDIYTFKAEDSKGRKVENFALNYVSTQYKELSIRYSLKVQQLSINKRAYIYWTSLGDQNSGDGSLYFQQPYQLRANVFNINDPDEIVLGYFNVAGISQKRIFVDRPLEVFHVNTECFIDSESMRDLRWTDSSVWPIFITTNLGRKTGIVDLICVDCREEGGKLEKPGYWVGRYDTK